jgi:hypothetical protein
MEDPIGYLDEIPSQLIFAAENLQRLHVCAVRCMKTEPAIERLLANITMSPKTDLCLSSESIEESVIGHFGFFHNLQLPGVSLRRLKFARVPEDHPAAVMRPCDPRGAYDEH